MKILLNLLPDEKKVEMRRNKRFRMIIAHGSVVVFIGFFYCCALLGISRLLTSQLASARSLSNGSATSIAGATEVESYEALYRETNQKVSEVARLLGGHVSWGRLFRSLDVATPPGVSYTSISAKNDLVFSASGIAPNRETLLLLERNMNQSECFRDALVPLSDKLVKNNIDFQLDAAIEKSCLLGERK